MRDTTIAAIATAYGESGIGIVRMSGEEAPRIAREIFDGPALLPRVMRHGFIRRPEGEVLDEALCVLMPGPHSYTGEDVVEIQCHGSLASLKSILALCLERGAQMAEPGEFTKRAFLNGRIDLSQAEAVIDVVRARTERSLDAAVGQLQGRLSAAVSAARGELKDLLVLLAVNMDYPDEDIEEITYKQVEDRLSQIDDEILKLLESAPEGKIVREGLSLAIVGPPNAGKSSLMNLVLNEDRSIVTDLPGTTRDTVEESASLRGIPVRLVDTAGIRRTGDPVEALGVARSKAAAMQADLLLFVLDASAPLSEEDRALLALGEGKPCVVLLNKQDLPAVLTEGEILEALPQAQTVPSCLIRGEGVEVLKDAIEETVAGGKLHRSGDLLVTNVRHAQLLRQAHAELAEGLRAARGREAIDFVEVNARAAFDLLGQITGETADGEIIEEIFSRFCLGK